MTRVASSLPSLRPNSLRPTIIANRRLRSGQGIGGPIGTTTPIISPRMNPKFTTKIPPRLSKFRHTHLKVFAPRPVQRLVDLGLKTTVISAVQRSTTKGPQMKYAGDRPYSDPEKAARRLMEHARAFEPD